VHRKACCVGRSDWQSALGLVQPTIVGLENDVSVAGEHVCVCYVAFGGAVHIGRDLVDWDAGVPTQRAVIRADTTADFR
jgi:hypothetical protein